MQQGLEGLGGAVVQIEALAGEDVVVDRLLAERVPEGDQLAVAFAAEDALVERLPEPVAAFGASIPARPELIGAIHREYLAAPPPDEPADTDVDTDQPGSADGTRPPAEHETPEARSRPTDVSTWPATSRAPAGRS